MFKQGMIGLGMNFEKHGLRLGPVALMVALACSTPGRAQQFSAELVRTQDGVTAPIGPLRVFDDKVRIESRDFPDGFFLIDGGKPSAYFVRPAVRLFMDAKQSNPLTRLFVTVDPDNPCRQWQAMAEVAGLADHDNWRCEPAGIETIGGRETTAFRAVPGNGSFFVGWIDRARRFPLRVKTDDGAYITAEAIRDEPQDAALFEIPKHARKFDPQALIERIKQSDVWVAAPKPEP
jgi:hypothetical protein